MRITVIPASQLSDAQVAAWSGLLHAGSDSPFFHAEFTRAVASVRSDVEVALLERDLSLVGFFPFQRRAGKVGRPVGAGMSDFQGVVIEPGVSLDPLQLIRACGLSSWHFDHLTGAEAAFAPFQWTCSDSPHIDVPSAFDTYLEDRRAAGGGDVLQALNKKRRAERQVGPVRFELRTADAGAFSKLIEWKVRQYEKMQVANVLSFPWTVALIERLLSLTDNRDFSGMLSTLYFGDRLAAVHFGLRSRHVVHWWFPAYDAELAKYSPGAQLLLELVRAARAAGITRIDLGKGMESYKRSFMTGKTQLSEGCVASRPTAAAMHRLWHHTKRWVKESPLHQPARVPWRMICRMRDQLLSQ